MLLPNKPSVKFTINGGTNCALKETKGSRLEIAKTSDEPAR